jgi:hypothetical protein
MTISACLAVALPIAIGSAASSQASASGQTSASGHQDASAATNHHGTSQGGFVTGKEHFQVYANAFEASFAPIYFTGPLTTAGTGYKDFSEGIDQAFLPVGNGTFELNHPGITQTTGVTTTTNPKTCEETVTGSGAVSFTHGTGAFSGISGSGTVYLKIRIWFRKNSSGCDETDPPWGYIEIANGYLNAKIPDAAITGAASGVPADS